MVTNDAHYLRRSDAKTQDVLLCVQTAKTVDDPNRMRFETEEFYLKSEAEMAQWFPGMEEAFENTAKIAQRCNVEFSFHEYKLPVFPVPRVTPARPISGNCASRALPPGTAGRRKPTANGWNMKLT